MHSFDVLDPQLQLGSSLFLEASAGTGKTFAIEHLTTRLIADGFSVEEILLVTFTRAATRDLRRRIRHHLKKTLTDPARAPYLVQDEVVQRRLKKAVLDLASAPIFTIHGFCYRMLTEFPLQAQVTPELLDPDRENSTHPLTQQTLDFLRAHLDFLSPSQLHILLKSCRKEISSLVKKLQMLAKGKLPPTRSFNELFECYNTRVRPCDFRSMMDALAPFLKGFAKVEESVAIYAAIFERGRATEEEFDYLIGVEENLFALEFKKKGTPPEDPMRTFLALQGQLGTVLEEARSSAHIMAYCASRLAVQIEKWQHESEVLGPDELLLQMQESLKQDLFLDAIRSQFKVAIIDEFQDTDPAQWNIFRTLFLQHAHFFCLVGDPKQSIYAFRGADLDTYFKAKWAFPEPAHQKLGTNYRSHPALIEALNTFFCSNSELGYDPVLAGVEAEGDFDDELGRLHFFCVSGPSSARGTFPTKEMEQFGYFPFIASQIMTHYQSGTPLNQQVVLIKDRHQAQRLQSYLIALGIPAISSARESICESPAFYLIRAFVKVLLSPRNIKAIKQVLYLLGVDPKRLTAGLESAHLQECVLVFRECVAQFEKGGFGAAFAVFLSAHLCDVAVIGGLCKHKDDGIYNDLMQLSELIALKPHTDPSDVLDYLDELEKLETDQDPRVRKRGGLEEDAIPIMTTFMSKGLEFDIVYALGVACRTPAPGEFLKSGHQYLFNDLNQSDAKAILESLEREKLRQLYVALTRAKKRVYVAWAKDTREKEPGIGTASPLELFSPLLPEGTHISHSLINHLEEPEHFSIESDESIIEPAKVAISIARQEVVSFTSLAPPHMGYSIPVVKEGDLPPGAETGVILHSIFERLVESGGYRDDKRMARIVEERVNATRLFPWYEQIYSIVHDTFTLPLGEFCLKDVEPARMIQEMEFLYDSGGRRVKGFIDLTFFHKGKWHIVDWKSNLLPGYTPDCLKEAMEANHYPLQAQLYKDAVTKFARSSGHTDAIGGIYYIFLRGPAVYGI